MKHFKFLLPVILCLVSVMLMTGWMTIAASAAGYTVSGQVTTYNPANPVSVSLTQNGTVIVSVQIPAEEGSGPVTQTFTLSDVPEGAYDLVVEKAGHLTYTVTGVEVTRFLDLALSPSSEVSKIELAVGDISDDGYIDSNDISMLVFDLGKTDEDCAYPLSDMNGDRYRDALDVTTLSFNLLKTSSEVSYVAPPNEGGGEEDDTSMTVLHSFDSAGNGGWWGTVSPIWKTTDAFEGSGYLGTDLAGSGSHVVCGNLYAEKSGAATAPENAAYPIESADSLDVTVEDHMTMAVYVSDADAVTTISFQLSSCRNGPLPSRTWTYIIDSISFVDGWNTVSFALSDGSAGESFDPENVQYVSLTVNCLAACEVGFDYWCGVTGDDPVTPVDPIDEPDEPDDPVTPDKPEPLVHRTYTDTVYNQGAVSGISFDEVERTYYLQVESTPMEAPAEAVTVQTGASSVSGDPVSSVQSLDGGWQMMAATGNESYYYSPEMIPTGTYSKINIVGLPVEASSQNTMMGEALFAPSNINDGAFNVDGEDTYVSGGPGVDPEPWFIIDLTEERSLNGFILYNFGALGVFDGSPRAENTRAFTVWFSTDKTNWTKVYSTTKNTASKTDVKFDESYTARYVKVTLEQTEQSAKGYARIVEFELYGAERVFTPDWLDWTDACTVTVPGSVPGGLYEAGLIEDPMVGLNDAPAREAVGRTWWMKKDFDYTPGTGRTVLSFDGICDRADVWINDTYLGFHQGMFGGPEYDVTDYVKDGRNTVVVRLYPIVGNWFDTVAFNISYGWTQVKMPPLGIWRSVNVKSLAPVEIKDPFIAARDTEGNMDFTCELINPEGGAVTGTLTAAITPKNFTGTSCFWTKSVNTQESETSLRLSFAIPDPKLWWPNGIGEQNLYLLTLRFTDEGGQVLSEKTVQFGIRTVEMHPLADVGEYSDVYNWTFTINGREVFLHGCNWYPVDALLNFTEARYERLLSLADNQGIQLIRSWGNGTVESETFYDLCDEYGICVFQEWPISWDSYQTQPEAVLYETVILNTRRLRNRASLIMWGGGNEGVAALTEDVLNEVGKLTLENDGTRPWHRTDPYGDASHLYDTYMGGMPLEENFTYESPFIGEFGIPSLPMRESISKYATAEEMNEWPLSHDNAISYHTVSFGNFETIMETGDIQNMTRYAEEFLPIESLDDLIVGSQLAQSVGLIHTLQRARANFPSSTGICYYKIDDVATCASWANVDYYGTPKMTYYMIQDVYQPIAAVAIFENASYYGQSATIPVYLLDDAQTLDGNSWRVNARVYNAALECVWSRSMEGTQSSVSRYLFDMELTPNLTASAPLFFVTEVVQDGAVIARNYYFLNYNDSQGCLFTLPVTTVTCEAEGQAFRVTNTGSYPAVAVSFDCSAVSDTFLPEDNYFWLEAGESRLIPVNDTTGITGVSFWNKADLSDLAAPAAPTGLVVTGCTADSVSLAWNTVSGARGYFVLSDGDVIAAVSGTSYTVYGLSENDSHTYTVCAYDDGGNVSSASASIDASSAADTTAPGITEWRMISAAAAEIVFDEPMLISSVCDTSNYALSDGASVTAVTYDADTQTATLTLWGVTGCGDYTLTVTGVKDDSAAKNAMPATSGILAQGLGLYWDFNAGTGHRLHDVTGRAGLGTLLTDAVVFENNTAAGLGYGVNFDGTISSIAIRKSQLSLANGFSLSVCVKTDVVSDSQMVALARNIYPISGFMNFSIYNGKPMFYSADLYPRVNFVADTAVADGSWHQIGVTYDGSVLKMYVDGRLTNTYSGISGTIRRDDCEWAIGRLVRNVNRFKGSVDEVRVYDRAITGSEMAGLADMIN